MNYFDLTCQFTGCKTLMIVLNYLKTLFYDRGERNRKLTKEFNPPFL